MSDLKAKIHQNRFRQVLRPRRRWGAKSAPRPLVVFKRPTSKGRETKEGEERKGKKREEEGREGQGNEGKEKNVSA